MAALDTTGRTVCCDEGLDGSIERPEIPGACAAAVGGTRRPWFTNISTWGDTMRRVIIGSLAATAVLGGTIFTGAGVAAADPERPTGGDNSSSAQPSCGPSDIDFEQGCFLGWGRSFK